MVYNLAINPTVKNLEFTKLKFSVTKHILSIVNSHHFCIFTT